jgi:hypothetical protein
VLEASFSPAGDGWHISAAETSSERERKVPAELNGVLLELVLSTIVLGEPAVGLRAELVGLSSPPARPAPPEGVDRAHHPGSAVLPVEAGRLGVLPALGVSREARATWGGMPAGHG